MKKLVRRLLSGVLSLITTCLIMVSPVAAMVYAAEPIEAGDNFKIKDAVEGKYTARKKDQFERKIERQLVKWDNKEISGDNALTGKE
ncbi:hypothetical protein SOV_06460 [Sporomusa ovata DSM 2662]|uniref:Uncharacterized protein n=1 Tax=Sporomusa ovata TaxID=2378 RepID=A0A0U1KYW2_9FIRM|nr:hypothetical protein [Sporomusa ovata]EQB28310.1 hypothetical protein SOV_2c12330 [Sporomusa ovata DSM 2662]CQR71854.1 hypothetical protein SpAn4DRAFT_3720 [Sporomusa ovata]